MLKKETFSTSPKVELAPLNEEESTDPPSHLELNTPPLITLHDYITMFSIPNMDTLSNTRLMKVDSLATAAKIPDCDTKFTSRMRHVLIVVNSVLTIVIV